MPRVGSGGPRRTPARDRSLAGARQPRALHEAGELVSAHLADPRSADQHRWVAIEVRRREERQGVIGQDGFLLELRFDPEHDDVGVALPVSGSTASGRGLRKKRKLRRLTWYTVGAMRPRAPPSLTPGSPRAISWMSSTVAGREPSPDDDAPVPSRRQDRHCDFVRPMSYDPARPPRLDRRAGQASAAPPASAAWNSAS